MVTKVDEFGDQSRRLCKIVQSKLHRNFVSTMLQFSLNSNSTFTYIKTTTDFTGETADVPVVGSADDVDVNLLYAPTTAITGNSLLYDDGENYNYILAQPAGKQIGFYRANNSNIAVGKAYLRIPQSLEARQFSFIGFDENGSETTGIVSVNNRNIDKMQRIYDLQGRRIDGQLSKGLYIVDGKKVIVK